MSCVTRCVSHVACHASHVTCNISLTLTATDMDSPPANSPTMHSRMNCKHSKINFFSAGQFKTISAPKLQILRQMSLHNFSLRNLFFVIYCFALGTLYMGVTRCTKQICKTTGNLEHCRGRGGQNMSKLFYVP